MRIVIEVDAPADATQGIKESLCMAIERWGTGRVVEITAKEPEQMKIGGKENAKVRR